MDIKCPKCNALNKFEDADYVPGSSNTEACWRCGEELSFTMPGEAPVKESAVIVSQKNTVTTQPQAASPAVNQTNAELEKARLALEAERIRLEHRKIDHEQEMMVQQQQAAYAAQQQQVNYAYDEVDVKPRKDKTTAGLLGIFLGGLGAHKFYLGKSGQGILYLLFCWTYIPGILGLIEGILYLTKNERDFHANCY